MTQLRKTAAPATSRGEHDLELKLEQLGGLVRRMVRVVRVPEDDADLTPTQVVVLSLLDERPMRIGVLAAAASAAQNTISEVVARLKRAGLVAKAVDPDDRRAVLVMLTDEGRHALESRRRSMREFHRSILNALSPRDRQRFVEAFEVLVTMAETARAQMTNQTSRTRRNDT